LQSETGPICQASTSSFFDERKTSLIIINQDRKKSCLRKNYNSKRKQTENN